MKKNFSHIYTQCKSVLATRAWLLHAWLMLRRAGDAMGYHPLAGWGNPWRQDPRPKRTLTAAGPALASDNRGIVLLVSLMIMLILTSSGIALSTVIINSLRSSRNTNQAAVAYYGAESGIERALFEATSARLGNDKLADTALSTDLNLSNEPLSLPGLSFSLSAESQDTTRKVTTSLARNQTYSLDFFNVDDSLVASAVQKVRLNWKSTEAGAPEWVEVSWVGWAGDSFTNNMSKRYYSSADQPVTFWITNKIQPLATRLRVKALKSDINDLTIETLDSNEGSVLIPESRLFITSVGAYQTSKQALSTDVRWQLPLSPIFDYAIFSEEPIVK